MQLDFIDVLGNATAGGIGSAPATSPAMSDGETLARHLEASGDFRVLRRLKHRPVVSDARLADGRSIRLGIVVDTETTGLDPARDEIMEFGGVAFTYDHGGIRAVVGTFEGLQEPSRPLSAPITRLTGLTDADLKGRSIDLTALSAFVGQADLVIAHNSAFDRPFCERLLPAFAEMRWGCSLSDVDWKKLGADGTKVGQLLASAGLFHGAHRALTDAFAVLEILSAPAYAGPEGAFAQIVKAAAEESFEIRAERAPYEMRSVLKARGYRWSPGTDGRVKCWTKVVSSSAYSGEIHFLRHDVYRDEGMPAVREIGPAERFRN